MLSTRFLAIVAFAAVAYSLPVSEKEPPRPITTITNDDFAPALPGPWFNVPFFGDITKLFAPLWKLFPRFDDLGPRIDVDDEKFQVVVQVKDYKKSDLKVKVKGDFVFVQGTHEASQDDHDVYASQFYHTYSLPANASAADVTAKLTSDNFLVITAPMDGAATKTKAEDREVPIEETGAPYTPPQETADVTTAQPEITTSAADPVTEDDRKEPTTPSNLDDATEKDNVIPHGNEVSP